MAFSNVSETMPSTLSLTDDDLGKWLDLDGLCQDSLTDGERSDSTPPDGYQDSTSMANQQPRSNGTETQHQEQQSKAMTRLKQKSLPRNRNFPEYSLICFPSNPAKPDGVKKKRKDFNEKRRLEVAQVRKTGACFRCKMRRISCGIGDPCTGCEKAAGALGTQMCIREKLTKMRFSSGELHYIDYTARLLDQELIAGTTHLGPPRKVAISMDYADNPVLNAEVQDFYGSETPPWLCCWVVMNQVGGQIEFHREESARYALLQLLPANDLISWVEKIIQHQDTRSIGFQQAVDSFVMGYSQASESLPMHDFVKKVHQLNCLAKIRLGLILCVDESGKTTAPSCALHTQFGQMSKTASQLIEKDVLSGLEKLVFGTSGIGPSNGIALWASLWCLILMYRKLVRSYIAFQQFPCHVPEDYSGFPECKLEAGTHFYHYLVSIYAALFRSTSPLYADFRVAATRQLLDDNEALIRAFMSIRTESFYFQRESCGMTASEDQLLRRMILDREADLQPKRTM
ncbi:Fc.00g064450.m01.CDS01 [Cosmosporella sp. VM-42]